MLWKINGVPYRAESLQNMSLIDLRTVREQTGKSMAEITALLESTAGDSTTGSADLDLTELDGDQLTAMAVLLWHARKAHGDRGPTGATLTIEEAADFPLRLLEVVLEPGDQGAEEVLDAGPNRAARRRAGKKTTAARKTTTAVQRKPRPSETSA